MNFFESGILSKWYLRSCQWRDRKLSDLIKKILNFSLCSDDERMT